jgi:hypothetical protein
MALPRTRVNRGTAGGVYTPVETGVDGGGCEGMVRASCHCGAVVLEVDSPPVEVTDCLLDMPAVRHPVGLLRAAAGARAPLRAAHRRLRVGRQDPRDPPLPELRLRLALGRHGSRGSLRRPHAILRRPLAELREVPRSRPRGSSERASNRCASENRGLRSAACSVGPQGGQKPLP